MQIDLRTVNITPLRNTFDHLARRFGDKPASRYQEGSYDIQAAENLHYRPTWAPEQALYDPALSKLRMRDWYVLKDPRQFYYNTYTLARARQQDSIEANFEFVESRGLVELLPDALRSTALELLVPLRHAAWGANQHNSFICGYGYGVVFTQPCMYHAMDNLGIAQYLSRAGLMLGGPEALAAGKRAWMEGESWQPLRHYVEDGLALRDPFELYVAQNLVLDGLLYPLVYARIVDGVFAAQGGAAIALLTQFMGEWFAETRKWVDAVIKVAAAESPENLTLIQTWTQAWGERARDALRPLAAIALGDGADAALAEESAAFAARADKLGLSISL